MQESDIHGTILYESEAYPKIKDNSFELKSNIYYLAIDIMR